MDDFYVYIIFRLSGVPLYVGKGRGDRWLRHEMLVIRKKHYNKHLVNIINQALTIGKDLPKIKVAEGLNESLAFDIERMLIAVIGRETSGGCLVNLTDGGDGESGRIITEWHKERLRVAHTGKTLTSEHKTNISLSLRGNIKVSLAQKKRYESEEERFKVGIFNKGRKRSSETAMKQKLNNPGHTGHTHSAETRARISAKISAIMARRKALSQMNLHFK